MLRATFCMPTLSSMQEFGYVQIVDKVNCRERNLESELM